MNPCSLIGLDLGRCIAGTVFGWVPSWLWPLLEHWPWLVGLVVAGLVWRFSGWPGVVALAGALGFLFGRRSMETTEWKHPDPEEVRRRPKENRRETIFDRWRR